MTELQVDFNKVENVIAWSNKKLDYHFRKHANRKMALMKGEIYYVDLGENIGSEENKQRPCVILHTDRKGILPIFTCAILSSSSVSVPAIQVEITGNYDFVDLYGRNKKLSGAIDLGQIQTLGKERILKKIATLNAELPEINMKLFNALDLSHELSKRENAIKNQKGKIEYLKKN